MVPTWDRWIQDAMESFDKVDQPLRRLVDPNINRELNRYLGTGTGYRSIATQKPRSLECATNPCAPSARRSANIERSRERKSRARA